MQRMYDVLVPWAPTARLRTRECKESRARQGWRTLEHSAGTGSDRRSLESPVPRRDGAKDFGLGSSSDLANTSSSTSSTASGLTHDQEVPEQPQGAASKVSLTPHLGHIAAGPHVLKVSQLRLEQEVQPNQTRSIRRLYISKADLRTSGYTGGCAACGATSTG